MDGLCRYYVTKRDWADLGVRIELGNRLLMPGRGRWRCIPDHLIAEDQRVNPDCFEIEWDEQGMDLDDDGTLHAAPAVTVDALRHQQNST